MPTYAITNDVETDTFKFFRPSKVNGHLQQGEHGIARENHREPGRLYRFFTGSDPVLARLVLLARPQCHHSAPYWTL